jgi:hypothetical protein
MTLRRALAFALVPLSALPLAAGAPLVAPSVEKRVQELRDRPGERAETRRPQRVDRDERRADRQVSARAATR